MAGIGLSMKTRRDMSGRIIFFTSQKGGAAPNSNPEISRYVFDAAPPFSIKFRFLLFCRLLKFLRPKEMPEPLPHALFPEAASTDSGLSDTAPDSQRQFALQKHFVERKISSVITACLCKLFVQGFLLHGFPWRKFQGHTAKAHARKEYHSLISSRHSPELSIGLSPEASTSPICIIHTVLCSFV